MSNPTPSASPPTVARRPPLAMLLAIAGPLALSGARAADMPFGGGDTPYAATERAGAIGGGGYWAPLVPVRPAPTRFDIYGYPILGSGLVGRPAPHAIGVGCPPALEPAYDPDGNLAGYAPLQYCR